MIYSLLIISLKLFSPDGFSACLSHKSKYTKRLLIAWSLSRSFWMGEGKIVVKLFSRSICYAQQKQCFFYMHAWCAIHGILILNYDFIFSQMSWFCDCFFSPTILPNRFGFDWISFGHALRTLSQWKRFSLKHSDCFAFQKNVKFN